MTEGERICLMCGGKVCCHNAYLQNAALSAERELAAVVLGALKRLLDDITEYQTINNLGGENNHWQVEARKALADYEQKENVK